MTISMALADLYIIIQVHVYACICIIFNCVCQYV